MKNWAGNQTFGTVRRHEPTTVDELREIVAASTKVKAFGSRHSFNEIADTDGDHVSTARLDRVLEVDPERRTVTVESGARYGSFCAQLDAAGFALGNLASLPHISVSGAIATATHGSGDGNRNLSAAVSAIEMVTASGDLVVLSRAQNGDRFCGAVVGLGALGIVTKVTLEVVPTFAVRQYVYENLTIETYAAHFEEIEASAYSVSLFTDWRSPTHINHVWRKERADSDGVEAPTEWFGATLATRDLHPIATESALNCTIQRGIPGPWYERLPHFKMGFTPSAGDELQTEYFVPRGSAIAAVRALACLRERIAELVQISEFRTIAADDLWMSPCRGQDSVGIHFTWNPDWPSVRTLLPEIEAQLAPFDARPHWGKLFTMTPERVRSLYPRMADFQTLAREFDPAGKFGNAFLVEYVL